MKFKNASLFLIVHLTQTIAMAQAQSLDTLYANAHQIISLSFESPIQKGIAGAPHFAFSFNQESAENLGLLQAQEGRESNLLVRTIDGKLYSFILKYREDLTHLHHFISDSQRLKNPLQNPPIDLIEKESVQVSAKPKIDYTQNCQKLMERQQSFHHIKQQKGLRLRMAENLYHNDKVYVVYELENRSAIPYELGHLKLLKILGTQKRKASYQQRPIMPLYSHHLPKVIGSHVTHRFVMVYPKFTLNAEEHLQLRILETNGSRNLTFRLR